MSEERQEVSAEDFKAAIVRNGIAQPFVLIEGGEVRISRITVHGDIVLDGALWSGAIKISNVVFTGEVHFASHDVSRLSFRECTFHILRTTQQHSPGGLVLCQISSLLLHDFSGHLDQYNAASVYSITFTHTTFRSHHVLALVGTRRLLLTECLLTSSFRLLKEGAKVEYLRLNRCQVKSRQILEKLAVGTVLFDHVELDGPVEMKSCEVAHVHIIGAHGTSRKLIFRGVKYTGQKVVAIESQKYVSSETSFLLQNSEIVEITWNECNWSNVEMIIDDIVIDKVSVQGSSVPRVIIPGEGKWKEVVDLFGMFEATSRSQGHMADALIHRASSLRAYRQYLARIEGDYRDRITLWLSEKISDYGTDWWQALKVLLLTLFGLYMIVTHLTDTGVQWWQVSAGSGRLFLEYFNSFVEFLSPLHKSDFLGVPLSPLATLVDSVGRICSGFIIYQLVRSTRKFVS